MDAEMSRTTIWIMEGFVTIIMLAHTTWKIKNDSNAKEEVGYYTLLYVGSMAPVINIFYFFGIISINIVALLIFITECIINYFCKYEKEKIQKEISEIEKFKILKKMLIEAQQFKDEQAIENFINGIQVANKLIE